MTHLQWSKTKPEFTEECVLVTANQRSKNYQYSFYVLEWKYCQSGWHLFFIHDDGHESIELPMPSADLYFTMPLIEK